MGGGPPSTDSGFLAHRERDPNAKATASAEDANALDAAVKELPSEGVWA